MAVIVTAERFDIQGKKLEEVKVSINRVGDMVYMFIQGEEDNSRKNFRLSLVEWGKLNLATEIDLLVRPY